MAKLLGIDVHKYYKEIDPQKAYDAGARFALIRAGGTAYDGSYFTDDYFERNAEVFPELMPVGFWWVFRPNYDAEAQADRFWALIRDKNWKIPPEWDVELTGGVGSEAFADSLLKGLRQMGQNLEEWQVMLQLIYTRATFFNRYVAERDQWPLYDLWIARYTSLPKPWGNPYDQSYVYPRDWAEWVFWQWSADGNGRGPEFGVPPDGDDDIDLDYFNGDQAAFDTKYRIYDHMPKIVAMKKVRTGNIRDGAQGYGITGIPEGTLLKVIDQENKPDGTIWYNVGGGWVKSTYVEVLE